MLLMGLFLKLRKLGRINCKFISHVGISFGGLLMGLKGKKIHLNVFLLEIDE